MGTFTNFTGQTECALCAIGFHNSVYVTAQLASERALAALMDARRRPGASQCVACEAGRLGTAAGQEFCSLCPEGSATNATGAVECSRCSRESWRAERPTRATCLTVRAAAGYAADGVSTVACTACTPGLYAEEFGLAFCLSCPAGRKTALNATVVCSPPFPIAPPRPLTVARRQRCADCEAGYFSSGATPTACTACAAGRFSGLGSGTCEVRRAAIRALGLGGVGG